MKRSLVYVLIVALPLTLVAEGQAPQPKSSYVLREFGLSLEPPAIEKPGQGNFVVAYFFLPPAEGFAANVNVMRQAHAGSIKEYSALSDGQFKKAGMTVLKRDLKENQVVYEYTGSQGGRELHWYSRAIKKGGFVFLATATGLALHWDKQKAALMKSVDSFKAG